jgi:hypothetical protein
MTSNDGIMNELIIVKGVKLGRRTQKKKER